MLISQQSSEGLPPIPKKTTQRCRNSATSRPSVATTAPGARFANAFSSAKANCLARCALEEASASPRGNVTISVQPRSLSEPRDGARMVQHQRCTPTSPLLARGKGSFFFRAVSYFRVLYAERCPDPFMHYALTKYYICTMGQVPAFTKLASEQRTSACLCVHVHPL